MSPQATYGAKKPMPISTKRTQRGISASIRSNGIQPVRLNSPRSTRPRDTTAVATLDTSIHSVTSDNGIYTESRNTREAQSANSGEQEDPYHQIRPVLLQSITALPPGTPYTLPEDFDFITSCEMLQRKRISYEKGPPLKRLEEGNHVAGGHFKIGPFGKEIENKFLYEMDRCGAFDMFSSDRLTVMASRMSTIIDDEVMRISRMCFRNWRMFTDHMQRKYKVILRLRIKRATALIDKAASTTIHFDDNEGFQWQFRIIFTFGNWLKLFGFTESYSKNDPMYMKLLTHGSFVVMDPIAAGCSIAEMGVKSPDPLHAASLLPKADGAKENPVLWTWTCDVQLPDPENPIWKNSTQLRDCIANDGFGSPGVY